MDRERTIARLLAGPHPHRIGPRRDTATLLRTARHQHAKTGAQAKDQTAWQTMVDRAIDRMRSGRRTAS